MQSAGLWNFPLHVMHQNALGKKVADGKYLSSTGSFAMLRCMSGQDCSAPRLLLEKHTKRGTSLALECAGRACGCRHAACFMRMVSNGAGPVFFDCALYHGRTLTMRNCMVNLCTLPAPRGPNSHRNPSCTSLDTVALSWACSVAVVDAVVR